VIHGGLYYEPDAEGSTGVEAPTTGRTVRARRGASALVQAIVATSADQAPALEVISGRAARAGVEDLAWLAAAQVHTLESAIACELALHSPSTGIVDSHALMLSLLGAAEDHGAVLSCRSRVLDVRRGADGLGVSIEAGGETMELHCRELVNSAGLGAVALARKIEGLAVEALPVAWLAKGSYFTLQGRCPFSRLVYPVPNDAGLGVHLTLDLAGQGRFGPDVEWVSEEDYEVDPQRGIRFEEEIRRYWPGLPAGVLQPAYAGIRPKIAGPEEGSRDFIISGPEEHGLPGIVNLFGIESPGLTSSLAIAARVRGLLERAA
jgi:L-2-hydroxyglutarate oxidase LhgO